MLLVQELQLRSGAVVAGELESDDDGRVLKIEAEVQFFFFSLLFEYLQVPLPFSCELPML